MLFVFVCSTHNGAIIGAPNKPLVPTRNGEAPLLAAHAGR
jgi:hypothetical protein